MTLATPASPLPVGKKSGPDRRIILAIEALTEAESPLPVGKKSGPDSNNSGWLQWVEKKSPLPVGKKSGPDAYLVWHNESAWLQVTTACRQEVRTGLEAQLTKACFNCGVTTACRQEVRTGHIRNGTNSYIVYESPLPVGKKSGPDLWRGTGKAQQLEVSPLPVGKKSGPDATLLSSIQKRLGVSPLPVGKKSGPDGHFRPCGTELAKLRSPLPVGKKSGPDES